MNDLIEKLLQPVSADQPCGPDLGYDPRYDALETLVKGTPEVEVGSVVRPAEPPDWKAVCDQAAAFLEQSKHLRVAVLLGCGWLKVRGLEGFRDGLQLVRGLLEQYWDPVYPRLDPDDNNDPLQRLNILGALTSPRGTLRPDIQQWVAIVDYLHTTPLCQPKGAESITLDDVAAASQAAGSGDATLANQVAAAFSHATPEELTARHQAVTEAIDALAGIDAFLTATLGSGTTISFEDLLSTLSLIQRTLASHLPGAAGETAAPAGEATIAAGGAAGPSAGATLSGPIRSRQDVVRAIDSLCAYYQACEPASPVPLLLRRAQKMATMNFVEALQELNLANLDQLRPSFGSALEQPAAGEPPPE